MEPPRHFLHSFSSSKGKQVNEATLHGDLAGPPTSPRGSFARGPTLAQRALGALEWRRGTSPEEQDAAGQRLLLLEDWAELHPAPGPGATPSPPRLQRPHHAHTDSESTPWAAGAPDYRASQSREGQGVGDAGRAPVRGGCRGPDRPSCWGLGRGLGRGTTWDRLQPSAVKTPASLPQPPRLNRRPAQRPSKRRVSPQGAAAAPTRPGAGRGVVPFPRPGPPPLAQPSPQGSQLTRARVGPQALPGLHRHASQPGQWTCPMSHGQRGTGRVQGGGRAPSNYCWGWGGFLGPCRAGEVGQGSVWPQAFQHFSGKCPDLQFLHKASTV